MARPTDPRKPSPISFFWTCQFLALVYFWTDGWGLRVTLWTRFTGGFSIAYWAENWLNEWLHETGIYILRPAKITREGEAIPIYEHHVWIVNTLWPAPFWVENKPCLAPSE